MDRVNIPAKFKVRSFFRSWDNRGHSKNLGSPCIRPRSIFSKIFNWLLFAWILWIYLPNLTFVALPIPEIIGGTSKIWGVFGFAYPPYSPKFLRAFVRMDPANIPAKFEVRSFTRFWNNRGTQKIRQFLDTPTLPFLQNFFMGLYSDRPCECIGQLCSP